METSKKHLIVVAGEDSGDLHAAHLVKAIRALDPTITFSGLGGPNMDACGVKLYYDLTKIAVVGFFEVLKHYREFKQIFDDIYKKIKEIRPEAVILVDYPGFNLRLAKKIKKLNIKVIYYISPQVWAWKENRVNLIKKNVDEMLVLFKFEEDFYQKRGVRSKFVGHPLTEIIKVSTTKGQYLRSVGFEDYRLTIGLLPGSRAKEVERHLPIMLEAAQILQKEYPMLQFLVIKAESINSGSIEPLTNNSSLPVRIIDQNRYDALNACDVCIVTSGTATLETALLKKPMIVMYKTSLLTWLIAKALIKIPYIGLVNVVAQKKIVPECVQFNATGKKVAAELKAIFTDEIKITQIKDDLSDVKERLGSGSAGTQAARAVLKAIS